MAAQQATAVEPAHNADTAVGGVQLDELDKERARLGQATRPPRPVADRQDERLGLWQPPRRRTLLIACRSSVTERESSKRQTGSRPLLRLRGEFLRSLFKTGLGHSAWRPWPNQHATTPAKVKRGTDHQCSSARLTVEDS